MKIMIIIIISILFISSCSSLRESAGVTRKSIDEFSVIENPPLIIPPDFNFSESTEVKKKQIENIESELAKEILFGLDQNNIPILKNTGTINQILLNTNALDVSASIRDEIDQDFAQEIETDSIFQMNFENEVDILDAVKESELNRNKLFNGQLISSGELPVKKKIMKIKKKKRFIFF